MLIASLKLDPGMTAALVEGKPKKVRVIHNASIGLVSNAEHEPNFSSGARLRRIDCDHR